MVASRRDLAPGATDPASRAALLGPGLRSPALLAAVETMEGGRAQARPAPPPPHHPPPAGLTPSRPLRRPAADALEAPTHTAPAGQWPEEWGITNCSDAFYKAITL